MKTNSLSAWILAVRPYSLGNSVILVLIGRQGCFKTSFFQNLLPPVLRRYYASKTNSQRLTKDDLFTMTENLLVNFEEIDSMQRSELNQLKAMQADGTFDMLPKKEVAGLELEIEKLEKYLGGITEMKKIPQAMFIVDPRKERIAVSEAIKLGLPIVAIVDTNCDPDEIDYVIPGNDDAIRAVKLIAGAMANAVIEGRDGKDTADEAAEAPAAEKKPAKKPAKKADKADKAE